MANWFNANSQFRIGIVHFLAAFWIVKYVIFIIASSSGKAALFFVNEQSYGLRRDFWDVLRMVTDNAAEMRGLPERMVRICEGERAYFTVFEVKEGEFIFSDADGKTKKCGRKFLPGFSVIGTMLFRNL